MVGSYTKRFGKMFKCINSNAIKSYAHLDNQNSFSRNRKMPLADIVLCTLYKKGLTTTMEIHKYFTQKGAATMNISKQGYLQQRKKLSYEAFSFLKREYCPFLYKIETPNSLYLVFLRIASYFIFNQRLPLCDMLQINTYFFIRFWYSCEQ